MTTERTIVRDLTEIDGFAVRAGPHLVIIVISSTVPSWARKPMARRLSASIHADPSPWATAVIDPPGAKRRRNPASRRQRGWWVASVAAALIVNLEIAG